ncbi:MAG: hypothetical protein JWQ09_3333 [Segetibacter sp.]|nr:hypothetical protein [Segetibacter sp.]
MKNKIVLTIIITISSIAIRAQDSSLYDLKPYFAAVIVNNIDSSVVWYQSVFRLKVKNRMNEQEGFKIVILESANLLYCTRGKKVS